ncbi:hypothetical protein SK128_010004 [Halocaridina rubra]|uniref:TIR domain-containing protein n=1 Tax=Halocaridina rubra TaxID=373956 RepID=A0AAN8XP18_HALRR
MPRYKVKRENGNPCTETVSGMSFASLNLREVNCSPGTPRSKFNNLRSSFHQSTTVESHIFVNTSQEVSATKMALSTSALTLIAPFADALVNFPAFESLSVKHSEKLDLNDSSEEDTSSSHHKAPTQKSSNEDILQRCSETLLTSGRKRNLNSSDMTKLFNELRLKLINEVGPLKYKHLYKNHVQQTHFLIIYADEDPDREMAWEIKMKLEHCCSTFKIQGKWNILLGMQRLDAWQKLIESATTILVIISRALCRDKVLTLVFPEVLIRNQVVVPLFLEPFTEDDVEREIPSQLRPIVYKYGTELYTDRCNIGNYVQKLYKLFEYERHFKQEIKSLASLLHKYVQDPAYICPCGKC